MSASGEGAMLRDFWYLATAASAIVPGKTLPITILGEPLILARVDGAVVAYADACPHRGMPLRHGSFNGTHFQCCYHGWTFAGSDGRCSSIPALAKEDQTNPMQFGLRGYPCEEAQGNVWVFMAATRKLPSPLPPVPRVPGFDNEAPQITTTMRFHSNADIAAMGFCDPAHPAFVHTSRWWKSKGALVLRPKTKAFEPIEYGFRMIQHKVSGGANPYKLLGANPIVEVSVMLPGLRIEQIRGERHAACVLAAATPITDDVTDVHYCVYWTIPWLFILRPIAASMARDFLRQDLNMAEKLAAGSAQTPMLYVGDPDKQVAWFLRLKREYIASRASNRPFENPIQAQTLSWRS